MRVATITAANGQSKAVVLDWIVAVERRVVHDTERVVLLPLMGDPIVVWSVYRPSVWDGDIAARDRRDANANTEVERWSKILAGVPAPEINVVAT